ncbi:hypothetical protein FRB94_010577 [Tulasnella sp. JGI-2019a]|nr:hypothetical protein FRB94_010577 [Tulasnella sp. JGI-2019a]
MFMDDDKGFADMASNPSLDRLVLFTRNLPLPLRGYLVQLNLYRAFVNPSGIPVLFGHNLHLTSFNNAAKQLLGPSVDDHPHAAFFFSQEPTDSGGAIAALSAAMTKQDQMVDDETHLDWAVGNKIQLWIGCKGERAGRWYEAIVQHLPSPNEETRAHMAETTLQQYVLLLRRLTAEQIPTSASLPASPAHPEYTDEEKKHREQDTGLKHIFENFVVPQGLTHAQLQSIVDHMSHMCAIVKPDGTPLYYNQNWFEYTGLSWEQAGDVRNFMALHHADDMPSVLGQWGYSRDTREPFNVEFRLRALDRSWRCVMARGNPVRDDAGSITHWVLTFTDIDELVQARSDAVKAKEHIKAVLDGANVLVFSVTRDFVVTFFGGSSNIVSASAVMADKVVGSLLQSVWPDPTLHDEVKKVITEHKESVTFENKVESHGRHYRYRLTPLYGQGEVDEMVNNAIGVIIVASDVTEFVAAEVALQQAELERTSLMASETAAREASKLKTHFVTNISHEIRTPIAHMIGISELLLTDPALNKSQHRLVEKCLHSGEILLELVGMVPDMGKVEAGKLELEQNLFSLSDVVADAELFALAAQKKGLEFIQDISPSLFSGQLIGDRLRLRQALANFPSNAVKFTSRGSITLHMYDEAGNQPSEVMVTMEVRDTGCGIEGDAMRRLFKPFHQADSSTVRQFGGSGLGLFLAQSFVAKMGGHITLESKYGQSTVISARIPFMKADLPPETFPQSPLGLPSESQPPNEQTGAPALNRWDVRLLLADDNDLISMQETLTRMDFLVDTVSDGMQAVKAAETGKYHLILMDGQMPGMDGYEATRLIRQSTNISVRDIKVIALTASAIRGDRERCLEAGMDAYLPKPVRSKALEEAILQQLTSTASRRSRDMPL